MRLRVKLRKFVSFSIAYSCCFLEKKFIIQKFLKYASLFNESKVYFNSLCATQNGPLTNAQIEWTMPNFGGGRGWYLCSHLNHEYPQNRSRDIIDGVQRPCTSGGRWGKFQRDNWIVRRITFFWLYGCSPSKLVLGHYQD